MWGGGEENLNKLTLGSLDLHEDLKRMLLKGPLLFLLQLVGRLAPVLLFLRDLLLMLLHPLLVVLLYGHSGLPDNVKTSVTSQKRR